jgi:hypothetical protein
MHLSIWCDHQKIDRCHTIGDIIPIPVCPSKSRSPQTFLQKMKLCSGRYHWPQPRSYKARSCYHPVYFFNFNSLQEVRHFINQCKDISTTTTNNLSPFNSLTKMRCGQIRWVSQLRRTLEWILTLIEKEVPIRQRDQLGSGK